MLAAYSKLKWDWPNLRLLVVGGGNPDADSMRIISERNLQDVVFLGRVSDEDKFRYYKTADIYCAPATGKESFGIVLLEAMAAGVPIVASAIEGYSSVVKHGRRGPACAAKGRGRAGGCDCGGWLKDAALRRRLATAGMVQVQDYRWERVAQRVMDCYDSSRDAWPPSYFTTCCRFARLGGQDEQGFSPRDAFHFRRTACGGRARQIRCVAEYGYACGTGGGCDKARGSSAKGCCGSAAW